MTCDNRDSPSGNEPNNDGHLLGSGTLKKGPWTQDEDAVLKEYVAKMGEGNWNAVQRHTGLSRCGKSCRLRWVNHLKPNLKKCQITEEEEQIICMLHSRLGNKWAKMAAQLPGRTDNEIKNFWNTRAKKLQRSQLPIYPENVLRLKKSSETRQSQVSGTFSNERPSSHNFVGAGDLEIPVFEIEGPLNQALYSHQLKLLDIPTSHMPSQGLVSSHRFHCPAPTMRTQKRFRESVTSHGLTDTAISYFFRQRNCYTPIKHHHHSELPPLPEMYCIGDPSMMLLSGSHALINGNLPTSEPNYESWKEELPSLQSSYDPPPSPIPSLECTDNTVVQSTQAGPVQFRKTIDTDGLLESLLGTQNEEKISEVESETNLPEKTTCDLDDYLLDFPDLKWEASSDPISPMDSSAASISNNFTPLSGRSADELQPTDPMLPGIQLGTSDAELMPRTTSLTSSSLNQTIYPRQIDPSRPDTWLDANFLSPDSEQARDYCILQKAVLDLITDDEYNLDGQHPPPQL